jgi:ribosomal protein S18 acetylase RimI-like enzyme
MNPNTLLGETNEQVAIQTLVAAFANDPAVRWMYPRDTQYRTHFPKFVRLFAGGAFSRGTADTIAEGGGVALWLPPGVQPAEAPLLTHLQVSVAEPQQPAMLELLGQMGAFHPTEPHWYLPLIGVDPRLQGRGLGAALLAESLRRCDRDGLPAYLEATNPRNMSLYERHGFRPIGQIQAGDSPFLIPMLRPAQ